MKKLSKHHWEWLKRRGILLRNKQKRNKCKPPSKVIVWWDRSIEAPRIFDLGNERYRTELLAFIDSMYATAKPAERLRLDFRGTERIVADAMLLFLARLELAVLDKTRFAKIKIALPINNDVRKQQRVRQVLTLVGVFSICGQNIHIQPTDDAVMFWKKLSGHTTNRLKPREINDFLEDNARGISNVLSAAFKEALLNIKHHAYHNDGGGWWSFVHIKDNATTVVVCDLGMGIPGSVKQADGEVQKQILNKITRFARRFGINPRDSDFIRGSIKYGASGTGQAHRGKGLPKMKQVVESIRSSGARLNIYSNRGCYTLRSGDSVPAALHEYNDSIGGTVVTWTIPVDPNEVTKS